MDCHFCNRDILEGKVIAETKNFMLLVGRGQLVEGYTLIIPKTHVLCFGMMPGEMLEEYIGFKKAVEKAVTAEYQKPIYFEHGIVGQSVPHAHMHCVPTDKDILHRLVAFHHKTISSELELPGIFNEFRRYWFYECRGQFVFDVTRDLKFYEPKMFEMALRCALAEELGLPELGNWINVRQKEDDRLIERAAGKLEKYF